MSVASTVSPQVVFAGSPGRASDGVRWDDRWEEALLGLLDDLELQAEGLHLAERAAEVEELSVAQYAEVELVARVHASVGSRVRVSTADGMDVHGRLSRAGSDWMLVDDGSGGAVFVSLGAIVVVVGLASGALPEAARSLTARLSLRSVLRGLAADHESCTLHLSGGRTLHARLCRVGADFVELDQVEGPGVVTVPLSAVTVVRGRAG